MKKNEDKIIVISMLFALVALILVGCGGQKDVATNEKNENKNNNKIVLKLASVTKDMVTTPAGKAAQLFVDEMKKRVGDKVEIQVYPGGQLGSTTEAVLGGLQNRAFEIAVWNVNSFSEYTNAFSPLDIPYLFLNKEEARKFIDGHGGKIMKKKVTEDSGLRIISYLDNGFRHMTNNKRPLEKPEDLKGLKIRVQNNPAHMEFIKQFGAAPTPIAYTELFTALQQGVVDGQENPIVNIYDQNYQEVQKYMTLTCHMYNYGALVMSEEYYNSLPEDVRKAIDESSVIAQKYSKEALDEIEEEQLKTLAKSMQVITLTEDQLKKFQEVAKGSWDKIITDYVGKEYFEQISSALENN
ncbi:MAG: TRAP-type transport system periplasmic protein [Eubacteriaceae bacterium]|nr:TRAP-type transport system periplasmic protein [Eubacteriaceae bacterium]